MKNVTIKKFSHAEVDAPKETFGFMKIPDSHTLIRAEGEDLEVSDGYHTFDELYAHRIALFIALASLCRRQELKVGEFPDQPFVWRSKLHSDGTMFENWFVMGIGSFKGQQITYHLPISNWEETNFAQTLENAPEWDGHTPADVIERLKTL